MLGERGFKKLQNRKTKVASWYFDLNLILDYWGCFGAKRFYHHTGMVSNWWGSSCTLADSMLEHQTPNLQSELLEP